MSRTVVIGKHGPLTVEQARAEAKRLLGVIAGGGDPAADKAAKRGATTLADVAADWLGFNPADPKTKPKASDRRKKSTQQEYARVLRLHALPKLGSRALAEVTVMDVRRAAAALEDRPAQRNALLRVLAALFSFAQKHDHVPDGHNPAKASKVDRSREEGRSHFLSRDELARLADALGEAETVGLAVDGGSAGERRIKFDEYTVAAFRLLLLTGCRLREVLNLRWVNVDLERGVINLPTAKRGARAVVLNRAAVDILTGLTRLGELVIAGDALDKPRADLKKPWGRLRAAAGLEGVRLHDLRHTVGATAASAGLGLQLTGRLLGHRSAAATVRYAHIADDAHRRAAELVGGVIGEALRLPVPKVD